LDKLVALGKQHNVPYISLTTNANLLTEEKIENLIKAGLNEFTISLHGVTKESYENFMKKASYEKFHNAFKAFEKLKQSYDFKVRINYTFNKDNFYELSEFFNHFKGKSFDILQIRPIQRIGNTEYNDFDLESLRKDYPAIKEEIRQQCKSNNILLMAPNQIPRKGEINASSFIFDYTFCYVSPNKFWKGGFNWKEESFNEFSERIGWGKQLWQNVFASQKKLTTRSNKLNYEIDFN
jgi:MoaA/NifB/PqqE/SkfB family radical SAM enzyme